MSISFDLETDIPDMGGKVVFITGGMSDVLILLVFDSPSYRVL